MISTHSVTVNQYSRLLLRNWHFHCIVTIHFARPCHHQTSKVCFCHKWCVRCILHYPLLLFVQSRRLYSTSWRYSTKCHKECTCTVHFSSELLKESPLLIHTNCYYLCFHPNTCAVMAIQQLFIQCSTLLVKHRETYIVSAVILCFAVRHVPTTNIKHSLEFEQIKGYRSVCRASMVICCY